MNVLRPHSVDGRDVLRAGGKDHDRIHFSQQRYVLPRFTDRLRELDAPVLMHRHIHKQVQRARRFRRHQADGIQGQEEVFVATVMMTDETQLP